MRAWRRLTPRGRIVALGGLAVAMAGWWMAQRDLFWLGVFGVALALGAAIMVSAPVRGLRHQRHVPARSVPLGTPFTVTLEVHADGASRRRLLHFEEVVSPALGLRPRFSMSGGIGAWGEQLSYCLTATRRGRHRIGPLLVRSLDPFGLARHDMAFSSSSEVAVAPRIHELGRFASGIPGSSGQTRAGHAGLVGHDDVLVRQYRRGDDVRRVHWRSTARTGDLMVRGEEQGWRPTARLLLDNRRGAHRGDGPDSSFEWAVSAVASIGLALLSSGITVELVDADGAGESDGNDQAMRAQYLLDAMTDEQPSQATGLQAMSRAERGWRRGEAVIAVLGALTADDASVLLGLRAGSTTAIAILLDVDSFDGAPSAPDSVRQARELSDQGWTVVVADAQTTVPAAWEQAHRAAETAS